MEILRTLGQLVDSQKDLLEAISASNHHVHQPDAVHPRITPPSSAVHNGRLPNPWAEEAASWASPRYNESVLEPSRSGPGLISDHRSNDSHSPGTPFEREQREGPRPILAETSPGAFTIGGNRAALRWFGLLANDAGREFIQTAECEAQPSRGLLDDAASAGATPLQTATRIVDGSPDTIETSNYRMSIADDIGLPARMSERQLWQAEDVIQLLPSEKVVFETFVQHTSFWVCFSYSTHISLRWTDIVATFPSNRLIYSIPDAIFLQ